MIKNNNFKRMCSLYVSNIHFVTMILPYLSEKLGKGEKVITFLENDLQNEVELLVSKININEDLKIKIKQINWSKTEKIKYLEIKEKFQNIHERINVIVVGTNEYIDTINANIEKYFNECDGAIINEIDAYELDDGKTQANNIINKYKYLLNTSGECLISEIFGKKELYSK